MRARGSATPPFGILRRRFTDAAGTQSRCRRPIAAVRCLVQRLSRSAAAYWLPQAPGKACGRWCFRRCLAKDRKSAPRPWLYAGELCGMRDAAASCLACGAACVIWLRRASCDARRRPSAALPTGCQAHNQATSPLIWPPSEAAWRYSRASFHRARPLARRGMIVSDCLEAGLLRCTALPDLLGSGLPHSPPTPCRRRPVEVATGSADWWLTSPTRCVRLHLA